MERRAKQRLDLQLLCRIGPSKLLSAPVGTGAVLVSQNLSRTGILLRWLPSIPLPPIGSRLTLDVGLPRLPGQAARVMRCKAEVVRIELASDSHQLVGMKIGKIRFVQPSESAMNVDLASLQPATNLLN